MGKVNRMLSTLLIAIFIITYFPVVEIKAFAGEATTKNIKLTLMNPKNTKEPLPKAGIIIKNEYYPTDVNGEITVPEENMDTNQIIIVKAVVGEETYLYKAPQNIYTEDSIIAVDQKDLNKRNIVTTNTTNKDISFANRTVFIAVPERTNYKTTVTLNDK